MKDTTRNTAEVNRKNSADGDEARLETPGGVLVRKWDQTTAVSRHAFLPHFAAFLHAGGQFNLKNAVGLARIRARRPTAFLG